MREITPLELEEKIKNSEKLNMIDVREDEEVAEGMIPGAKHIPMMQIPERLEELQKDEEYIIICRSGNRSGRVCQFLEANGFNVVNLTGGMLNWSGEVVKK